MSKWLAEYKISSEISTQPAGVRLRHVHPKGKYTIVVRDARSEYNEDCELIAQIILEAPSIADAAKIAEAEIRKFLHLLSFVCNVHFRLLGRVGVINADKGAVAREAWIDAHGGPLPATSILNDDLLDTVNFLQSCGVTHLVAKALRWYANGILALNMEDQFEFFWLTVEILASAKKVTEKVADKCQKCRSDLYCPTCQETSMHRPFPRQLIKELIMSIRKHEDVTQALFDVRNGLTHGQSREDIEAELGAKFPGFAFESAVDTLARIAWHALVRQFETPAGTHRPAFLRPNTVVHRKLTATALMELGGRVDPDDLTEDCRPFAGVKVAIDHGA